MLKHFSSQTRSGVSFSPHTLVADIGDNATSIDVVSAINTGPLFKAAHDEYERHFLSSEDDCDGAELCSRLPTPDLRISDLREDSNEAEPCEVSHRSNDPMVMWYLMSTYSRKPLQTLERPPLYLAASGANSTKRLNVHLRGRN